jgi:hypothetical protein
MAVQHQDKVESAEELSSSDEKHSSESRKPNFGTRVESPKVKIKSKKKEYALGNAKYPSQKCAEVAILTILGRSSNTTGVRTSAVLKELKENFFKELSPVDLGARYPRSRKGVVDTSLKFGRKNLVQRGEVFPVGNSGSPVGIWRICEKGKRRLEKEMGAWAPKYVHHSNLLVEV